MKVLAAIVVFICFLGVDAVSQASNEKSNYPYSTISKEVHKIQYKNVKHVPAKITMVSPSLVQSKGTAQLLNKNVKSENRKLVRVGYPAWTISKGVARRQFEKNHAK